MPPRPRSLPPLLGDVFTTVRARELGVTGRRLRAKDLERAFRGARIVPERDTSHDERPLAADRRKRARVIRRARAVAAVMSPHAFFAGETAAAIYGAPLRSDFDPESDLTVAVHAPFRPPRRRGVHGIKVAPSLAPVVTHLGLRLCDPASTWAMMTKLSERNLIHLGDFLVFIPRDDRGRPLPENQLATMDQLRNAATKFRRHGKAELLRALERVRVGSASPLETDYRLAAEDAGLPEPALDVEVRDRAGRLIGISDVAYVAQRIIVEIEGDHHRTDRAQWDRDIAKYAALAAAGWEVIRLTARHVRGSHPRGPEIVRSALARHR